MSKSIIIEKNCEKNIIYERDLLVKINHSFITTLKFVFQDYENVYLVMDYLSGGDLRHQMNKIKKFTEEETKFIIACVILGLEYLHSNNILHRDIKPENLVFDEVGYIKIADFGIAKFHQSENSDETSGTFGYMSPEVLSGQNHTVKVDYYSLGVIVYELMIGSRPYIANTKSEMKDIVISKQVQIKKNQIPKGWSIEASDFVNKLIQRNCSNRLGNKGINEIKNHPWLKSINWKDLYSKRIQPPFRPYFGDNFDPVPNDSNQRLDSKTRTRYKNFLKDHGIKGTFKNFKYFDRESNPYDDKKSVISVASFKSSNLINPHQRYILSQSVDVIKEDDSSNLSFVSKSKVSCKASINKNANTARSLKNSMSFSECNKINSNIIPGTNLFNSNISSGLKNK